MTDNKEVKISADKYLKLLKAENALNALECAGVDNWAGYGQQHEYMASEKALLKEVNSKVVNSENKEQPRLNLKKKISRARVMLQEKEIKKTGYNKFSNYYYFELRDFLPYINKICDELGLYCEFQFESTKATLTITDSDADEDFREWSTPIEIAILKGCSAIQNIGGSQSFARRYLYIMAFEIAEADAIEGGEIDQDAEQGKQKINKASILAIRSLLDETQSNEKNFLEWAKVARIEDITNAELGTCITKLNRIKQAIAKEKKTEIKKTKEIKKEENTIPEYIDF